VDDPGRRSEGWTRPSMRVFQTELHQAILRLFTARPPLLPKHPQAHPPRHPPNPRPRLRDLDRAEVADRRLGEG
jgi:hypothetical protein